MEPLQPEDGLHAIGAALKVGQMLSFNDADVLPPALQQVMEPPWVSGGLSSRPFAQSVHLHLALHSTPICAGRRQGACTRRRRRRGSAGFGAVAQHVRGRGGCLEALAVALLAPRLFAVAARRVHGHPLVVSLDAGDEGGRLLLPDSHQRPRDLWLLQDFNR